MCGCKLGKKKVSELADQIEMLTGKRREPWSVHLEPHNYDDGTKSFNHVPYVSKGTEEGVLVNVEVASYVMPGLAQLLCLLHNNIDEIVAALQAKK